MNKFLIFILILIPSIIFAKDEVQVIPKIGGSYSSLFVEELNTNSKLGFYGGIAIDDLRKKYVTSQFEVSYNQKGTIIQYNNKDYTVSINYIDVSLSINPYTQITNNFRVNLLLGPFLDILKLYEDDSTLLRVKETNFKTYDTGIVFGAGFEINNVVFEGKYFLGMLNLDKTHKYDIKSLSFSFIIGYRIINFD